VSNRVAIENILAGLNLTNPSLADALRLMLGDIGELQGIVIPIKSQLQAATTPTPAPETPSAVTAQITSTGVRFAWVSGDPNTLFYELRELQGATDWDHATFITRTSSNEAFIDPISVGTHNYMVKTINRDYTYCIVPYAIDVTIPAIGPVSISSKVIDNNVLLSWTVPTSSFTIQHHKVEKNTIFLGYNDGTFMAIFETLSGTFTYKVTPIDIAGNVGPTSQIQVTVAQPPDFALQDVRLDDYTGIYSNCIKDVNGRIIGVLYLGETYQHHFTIRGWTKPQDQIDIGLTRFIQPNG